MKTILVLFGGCSTEYEVSLHSAYAVLSHMDPARYTQQGMGHHGRGSGSAIPATSPGWRTVLGSRRQTVSPAPHWWNGRPTLYYCWTAPSAVSSLTRYSQSSTARTARTVRYRDSLNWPGSRSSAAGHCPAPCAWTRTGPTSWRPWPASGSPGAMSFIPAMISAGSPRQRRNWDTRCLSSRSGPVPPSVSPKSPGRKSCPPPWRRHSATTAP